MIKVDLSGAAPFFDAAGPDYAAAAAAHRLLEEKSGPGAEFTGWTELPMRMKKGELKPILAAAAKIRSRSKALVVVGIGGSYLGARGAIELLRPLPGKDDPKVFFVGNGLSADYLNCVIEQLGDDDFDVNVISKSGTTLEPAVSFRVFRTMLEKKYGAAAKRHIFATTDVSRGVLRSMANAEGWECFTVPGDVGGRYSVLSAVGLLPMAVAGIDVAAVIDQAIATFGSLYRRSPDNPVWQYAAARQHLYGRGYSIELLASYEPSFRFMAEWWKQLYGESEGKDGKGLFPASVVFSTDLHSMGQYIQDGRRDLFETVVLFEKPKHEIVIGNDPANVDGLNFLEGRSMAYINRKAFEGTVLAHNDGGVPNIVLNAPDFSEDTLGQLIYFFERACAISGYMLGVNPFNQPGVESYKKNMFALLGKPGYEGEKEALEARLSK